MEKLSAKAEAALQEQAWAPADYAEWLRGRGWGEIGGAQYMLYEGLVPLMEIDPGAPNHAWTFGDDFSGTNGCFLVNGDGTVHEWDSSARELRATRLRFPEFIGRSKNEV